MPLQTSGSISLLDIQNEFGGSAPIEIYEYYGKGGVPSSGQISLGDFYGRSNTIVVGTKLPVYGTGAGTFPPPGWVGRVNGSQDDSATNIDFPFGWRIGDELYTTCYPSSNCYITFGSPSYIYYQINIGNPPYRKFLIGASDTSWQRLSYFTSSSKVIIRFEGTNNYNGSVGNPDIVYEITFFNPNLFSGRNVAELCVGNHAGASQIFNIANANQSLVPAGQMPALQANQSYVFDGSIDGTEFNVKSNRYVNY